MKFFMSQLHMRGVAPKYTIVAWMLQKWILIGIWIHACPYSNQMSAATKKPKIIIFILNKERQIYRFSKIQILDHINLYQINTHKIRKNIDFARISVNIGKFHWAKVKVKVGCVLNFTRFLFFYKNLINTKVLASLESLSIN